jgi:GSCFA family
MPNISIPEKSYFWDMQLMLTLDIPLLSRPVTYTDNILLVGSCFTEHISDRLQHHKFHVLQNPHGILFNPLSVAHSIDGYIDGKQYGGDELFYLNEIWNSWDHHTRFSHVDKQVALDGINQSQAAAGEFVKKADWVIITLGSAFQYYLKETGKPVANNHRAPAQWFEKRLLGVEEIVDALNTTLQKLHAANPYARVLFTISPVRHIRDGVVDNNRSKARLIEAVHQLCEQNELAHYFPAYELVIDILRDYRYYDIDFVHPNYMATTYVWEHFAKSCIAAEAQEVMQQVHEIMTARAHRTRFPTTEAHRKFKENYFAKTKALVEMYPMLDLGGELRYFGE